MGKYKQITVRHSAEISVLFQHAGVRGKKLLQMFPQYSRSTIYRHAKKNISSNAPIDNRKTNKGCPSKLTSKDIRNIKRAVMRLREREGSFTAPQIAAEAGLFGKVSQSTIRRVLNKSGYFYLQSRKKGLLMATDLRKRKGFCEQAKKLRLTRTFWTEGISMYLDGKGFQYKTNPLGQARAPKSREWRKRGEGLRFGCTAKGRKEGSVNCNFMVGISYNPGLFCANSTKEPSQGQKWLI